MKTAVIYARVSSTTDRQSTTRQVNELINYAASAKLSVREIYEEKISGAKKNVERPILIDCINICYTILKQIANIACPTGKILCFYI